MSRIGGARRLQQKLSAWVPWLIAALAVAARWLPAPRTIDDAFITFRYARNLLAGTGFVYNAGERVLGTTTGMTMAAPICRAALSQVTICPRSPRT